MLYIYELIAPFHRHSKYKELFKIYNYLRVSDIKDHNKQMHALMYKFSECILVRI